MASNKTPPLIARADVDRAVWQAAGWGLSLALPHSADKVVIAASCALRKRANPAELDGVARGIARTLPERFSLPAAMELAEEWYQRTTELSWGRLRGLHRSGWPVQIDLEGVHHLDRALSRGRGAVLWFSSFCDPVLLMRALAERGTPLCHLSAYTHGAPGHSRFGVRFVAPVHRSVEKRYLAERIVMRNSSSPGYVKRVRQSLGSNRAVSVRGDLALDATHEADCLGRHCAFSAGAPRIAHSAQAPLLTSAIARLGPAHYRVTIDEELRLPEGRREFVREAVAEYARRLDCRLMENPADWEGWRWIHRFVVSP